MEEINIRTFHKNFPMFEGSVKDIHHALRLHRPYNDEELVRYLQQNGCKAVFSEPLLLVPDQEYGKVMSLLSIKEIQFTDFRISHVDEQFELNKGGALDGNGNAIEDNFIVPGGWLRNYWEHNKEFLPTRAESFDDFIDIYVPEEDGLMIFNAACYDGVIVYDGIAGR